VPRDAHEAENPEKSVLGLTNVVYFTVRGDNRVDVRDFFLFFCDSPLRARSAGSSHLAGLLGLF
jgi:hypothetical protein